MFCEEREASQTSDLLCLVFAALTFSLLLDLEWLVFCLCNRQRDNKDTHHLGERDSFDSTPGWLGSVCDLWALKKQPTRFLQGKDDHTTAVCLSSCKMETGATPIPGSGFQKGALGHRPLPRTPPTHLLYPHSAFILGQPSYDKRKMPCSVNSVRLSMYPHTFSVSVQCSVTTR